MTMMKVTVLPMSNTPGMQFTKLQRINWQRTMQEHHRWNFSIGATRSGKTYLDYFKIPRRLQQYRNAEGLIALVGNTQTTLERNVLEPMRQIWGDQLIGSINSRNTVPMFGQYVHALGADNKKAIDKIRGIGLKYCYGDEVPTWAPGVFEMLMSRLDKPGACFDGTGNPASPTHPLKTFLDREDIDLALTTWTLDDNTFLDPAFMASLKSEYAGTVLYDRYILGRWVAAEGAIYRAFSDSLNDFLIDEIPKEQQGDYLGLSIGIDFGGNKSGHAFNASAISKDIRRVVTVNDHRKTGILTPDELNKDFMKFAISLMAEGWRIIEINADSAEQVLIAGLNSYLRKNGVPLVVKNAKKGAIIDRIRLYTSLMGSRRYKVYRRCKNTIEAFQTAVWNEKSQEDKRLDDGTSNIDTLDAQEYSTETWQHVLMAR